MKAADRQRQAQRVAQLAAAEKALIEQGCTCGERGVCAYCRYRDQYPPSW